MKAIILAAGFARRMRPLSIDRHKTLLEVGGRSIIARIVDELIVNDIADICVVTGYRADEVTSYLRQRYASVRFTFVNNENFATTNNIYSMALALEEFTPDDDILLIESDLIFEPAVLGRILRSAHPNVALVDRHRIGMDGTVVTVANSGVITQVIPSSLQDERFDFSDKYKTLNIYKFSADFCRTTFRRLLSYYAQVIDDNCYYELILGILIYMQQLEVHAEIIEGEAWAEVDDPNDLRAAEFLFCPPNRRAQLKSSWGGYWNAPVLDFAFIRNMYFPTPAMISELRANLPQLIVNYGSNSICRGHQACLLSVVRGEQSPRAEWGLRVLSNSAPVVRLTRRAVAGPYLRRVPPRFPGRADLFGQGRNQHGRCELRGKIGWARCFRQPEQPHWHGAANLGAGRVRHTTSRCHSVGRRVVHRVLWRAVHPSDGGERTSRQRDRPEESEQEPRGSGNTSWFRVHDLGGDTEPCFPGSSGLEREFSRRRITSSFCSSIEFELEDSLKRTMKDREQFVVGVAGIPFIDHVYPSGANFVLASLQVSPDASTQLVDELLRESIYVKDVSNKFDDGLCVLAAGGAPAVQESASL